MINNLSARVQRIKPSPTLAVSAKAEELIASGKDIINLSLGEPDFDTPSFIKEAAIKAIKDGLTKYTAVDGTLSLKKAIINKFARDNGLDYTPAQIIVSCGAKHSLFNLFAAILNAGDEVIIPAPYWVSYPDIAKLTDAVPVIIETGVEKRFKISPQQLRNALTPKTRLLVLNSPANPTGVAYTKAELTALAEVLLNYPKVLIATDDIYEHTLWNPAFFINILMAEPKLYDQCIVINGASKCYAMTGWRIGYAAGPAPIINAMKKIQSQSTSNPCSISQYAVEAGLNGNQDFIQEMVAAYKERHDYILQEFQKIPGIICPPSDGTFYLFPSFKNVIAESKVINNDIELSEFLLNTAGIAVIPGSAFGAPDCIRISYATSLAHVKEAMKRLVTAIGQI